MSDIRVTASMGIPAIITKPCSSPLTILSCVKTGFK